MRRRDDALTAGVWQLEAGTISHPAVLLAGARRSIALFDLDLAERLVRAARGAGHGWEADWLLARVLQLRGRSAEAVDVLPGPPADGGVPFAMWAVTRASLVYWGLGEAAEAERILTSARPGSEPGTEKTGSDLTESIRSWIILYDGRCRAALDVAEAVLARPDGSAQSVVWATMAASSAAGLLGELARAERITDDGDPVAVAHADDLPWGVVQVRYGLCLALIATGQVRRARTLADEGYRSALAVGARPMTGLWAGFQGLAAKASGRLMDAQTNLRDALALLEGDDSYQMSRVCLAELAGALALTGEVAAARRFLDRADALAMGCNRLLDAWVVRNQAWVRAAEGNIDAAVRLASRAAELANDTQQPTTEALCLYDVARLGAAAQVYERIGLLATRVEGGFVTMLAVAAKALAIGDPEALELAATALVDQGQLLLAAEAAAAAARGYRQADQPDRAVALGERAAVLTGRCQGARTPLLALDGVHTVLTAREREIALLATTQSSRQIADHLDLSVHTVNNTLGRAFVKLGVTNRGELADLLIAPPR
jgi:DNA-binding CsgD family transcriptional regulator/tetratricopeptide (TPR) repeat protein